MASTFTFDAIGTSWTIDIPETLSSLKEESVLRLIQERIAIYDRTYSRFRKDSIVSAMALRAGVYELPEDSLELFALYREMYDVTKGKVTPLIGDTLVSLGYDALYSLQRQEEIVTPRPWDSVCSYAPYCMTMHVPALLDIGAGGKGYLVDIIGRLVEMEGIDSYTIDAGGDMLHKSARSQPLRVGLEDPRDSTCVVGVADVINGSVCGSAGNRRAWEGVHHIVDPFSGASPTEIVATWVFARTAFLADMLATALFFVPPETLMPHYDFSFVSMYADGTCLPSPHAPVTLYV